MASASLHDPDADGELLRGIVDAKPEAFHRFFEAWFPRVYTEATRAFGSRPHAEAVTRRCLVAALDEVRELAPDTPLAPWLLRRLRREIAHARRPTPP